MGYLTVGLVSHAYLVDQRSFVQRFLPIHSVFKHALSLGVLVFSGALVFPQSVPSRHRITHEDVWLMKRVGAPVPSPDGEWVVFPVTEPAYDEKEQVSDLWITRVDGREKPRQLTHTASSESGLAWSPDSRKFLFTAKREGDEVNQAYVMDLASGGEAVKVTSLSTGVSSPRWSPDGKRLLFVSTVFPGGADDEANKKIAAERKAQKYKARVYEVFPIRRWDKWLDDTQVHLFVQALEPKARAKDLLAGTKLVAEPGYAGKSADSGQDLEAIWAPDGQSIVFTATTTRHTAAYARGNTHHIKSPCKVVSQHSSRAVRQFRTAGFLAGRQSPIFVL
jgi:dipeptidyl aminopeptidase/acylaminoacyl peptidase